jgi:hypothetical protein
MKIRTRLILVFSVLAGLIALVSIAAVTAFARLGGSVGSVTRENLSSIDACTRMTAALARLDRGFLLLLGGPIETGRDGIAEAERDFRAAWAVARDHITLPGEEEAVAAVAERLAAFLAAAERFRAPPATPLAGTAPGSPALADYAVATQQVRTDAQAAINEVSALNRDRIDAAAQETDRLGWRRSAWVLVVGIVGVLLAVVLGIRLYRAIAVPLDKVARGIVEIGKGNLERRVGHAGRDELGVIAAAVNATAERLAAVEATREGRMRVYERLAGGILDTLAPAAIVLDREGRAVICGRHVRERFGDDPISVLRAGAGGLLAPSEIDRRIETAVRERASQAPPAPPATFESVVVEPIVGRAGSVLGAVVLLGAPSGLGRPGAHPLPHAGR